MKAIQVMLDERLLETLDASEEVQKEGRSAVLRRAVEAYLRQRQRASIATEYRKAYRGTASTHCPHLSTSRTRPWKRIGRGQRVTASLTGNFRRL